MYLNVFLHFESHSLYRPSAKTTFIVVFEVWSLKCFFYIKYCLFLFLCQTASKCFSFEFLDFLLIVLDIQNLPH